MKLILSIFFQISLISIAYTIKNKDFVNDLVQNTLTKDSYPSNN